MVDQEYRQLCINEARRARFFEELEAEHDEVAEQDAERPKRHASTAPWVGVANEDEASGSGMVVNLTTGRE